MSTGLSNRAILHVDMDAFFASVEVMDRPELHGKPVIVGGRPERRGVVCAASYEARAFGVHSAMSSAQALRLCPHAVFLRPRGRRYSEVSDQVFDILQQYTPLLEPLSIDEAFLDVTGCERLLGAPEAIGRAIKRRIREEVGLVASVGVAPNKFLAKLASDLRKPDGFVVIRAEEAAELLADLPVERLWGVGKVGQETLARLGIYRVRELRDCPRDSLRRHFGSWAERLLDLAWGRDDSPVEPESEAKSVGAETTFAVDIADSRELRHRLDLLSDGVARRLRQNDLRAQTVQLKARYADFTTVTRARTLSAPTSATCVIRQTARELLERRLGRVGRPLRLIGVSAFNLSSGDQGQLDLFGDPGVERAERLDRLVDRLREKHGAASIGHGCLADAPSEANDIRVSRSAAAFPRACCRRATPFRARSGRADTGPGSRGPS